MPQQHKLVQNIALLVGLVGETWAVIGNAKRTHFKAISQYLHIYLNVTVLPPCRAFGPGINLVIRPTTF